MTAQEKATELIENFMAKMPLADPGFVERLAKQCAIICVEMMMKEYSDPVMKWDNYHQERMNYLHQVKSELEQNH